MSKQFKLLVKGAGVLKACVVGAGYVGLVQAAILAHVGIRTALIEIDTEKVKQINRGVLPIYEPGLDDAFARYLGKTLLVTTEASREVPDSDVIYICVGTPPDPAGRPDLTSVFKAAQDLAPLAKTKAVLAVKSTVPPGTCRKIDHLLKEVSPDKELAVISNPEFLQEGTALNNALRPERIVLGGKAAWAKELVRSFDAAKDAPVVDTTWETAELIKYASNTFLAVKISYANELANLAEKLDVDIIEVTKAMGMDPRIGQRFLGAGVGYGGSCLPKDSLGLITVQSDLGLEPRILEAAQLVNTLRPRHVVQRLEEALGELNGRKIAVWGLSFKPGTDDLREAPALKIIPMLLEKGAVVFAYDPVAKEKAAKMLPKEVNIDEDMYAVVKDADALVIVTEWNHFKEANFALVKERLSGTLIFDGRNCLEPQTVINHGLQYLGVGRGSIKN